MKQKVIPHGMSVTKAAGVLGIGRPALSNFLNGNALLSPKMAIRLEKAFGVRRSKLLEMQSEFNAHKLTEEANALAVREYAPRYFQIKANQIEGWSKQIEARDLLAVLIRKLVISTSSMVTESDFPAYENSQRPGWDGYVSSDEATPWIPRGTSGWEFGVNNKIKTKADEDYKKRVGQIPLKTRRHTTFVFVTPRNWLGKKEWVAAKQTEKEWKDVRAYDASDLEQWLEQSVLAQAWLSQRLGIPQDGITFAEDWWDRWAGVCEPALKGVLFRKAVEVYRPKVREWLVLDPTKPLEIAADSADEAVAFAVEVLRSITIGDVCSADRAIVVENRSALPILSHGFSNTVALVNSPDAEIDLGSFPKKRHTIIIRHKGSMFGEPDIALGTVPSRNFIEALRAMGQSHNEASQISCETGNSITILRRRLSTVQEIKHPPWSKDKDMCRKLIPLTLIGAWRVDSEDDVEGIEVLTGEAFGKSEEIVAELLTGPEPPVWMVGDHRGMVSKINALYLVAPLMTKAHLENFFEVALVILSEDDPAFDLPEHLRCAAPLYGKARKSSSHLRRSLCETLVLLATHGTELFLNRLGVNVERRVDRLIYELLTPLKAKVWNSQRGTLPWLAEAAPIAFLSILEKDLNEAEPTVQTLFRPTTSGILGDCPRSELLWALEALAWKPERLSRVVQILAKLSCIELNDNWTNKPINSLKFIFQSWMPQTAANVYERKSVFSDLVETYPEIVWQLYVDQFSSRSRRDRYNYSPRFRNDAFGAGGLVSSEEMEQFSQHTVNTVLGWNGHDSRTLGTLVESMNFLQETDQAKVWILIDSWISSIPDDKEKAELRETIRRFALTQRGIGWYMPEHFRDSAQRTYDDLAPDNLITQHHWLFVEEWVEISDHELVDELHDYQTMQRYIRSLRVQAVEEIWLAQGLNGILDLLERSNTAFIIGHCLKDIVAKDLDDVITELIDHKGHVDAQRIDHCMVGLLASQEPGVVELLIQEAVSRSLCQKGREDAFLRLLCCAPFRKSIWDWVQKAGKSVKAKYWKKVTPRWIPGAIADLEDAIDELLDADRPQEALQLTERGVENVESARIIRTLRCVASSETDPLHRYSFANSGLFSYSIHRLLTELGKRKGASRQELAWLELPYISVLTGGGYGIPNLERELASSPDLFIQALTLAFSRNNDGHGTTELSGLKNNQVLLAKATSYSLLRSVRVIPGTEVGNRVDRKELTKWVKEARHLSVKCGRGPIGDEEIGRLLSNSPVGNDGVWPCEAVREVLADTKSEHIKNGMIVGVLNLRGVVSRSLGDGGDQERDLAEKYRIWQRQLTSRHWFTASVLGEIAKSYEDEARDLDTREEVRSRTGDFSV